MRSLNSRQLFQLFVVAVLFASLHLCPVVFGQGSDTGGNDDGDKGKGTPAPGPGPGPKPSGGPVPSGRSSEGPLKSWWAQCIEEGKKNATHLDTTSALMDCCSGLFACDCINKGCSGEHSKDDPNCKIPEKDRCHAKCDQDFTLASCNAITHKSWLGRNPWIWGVVGLGMILFVVLIVYCLCYMRKVTPKIKGKRGGGHSGGGGGGGSANRSGAGSRSRRMSSRGGKRGRGMSSAKRNSSSRRTSMNSRKAGGGRSVRRSVKVPNRQAAPPPPPPPPPPPEQSKKGGASSNPKNPGQSFIRKACV